MTLRTLKFAALLASLLFSTMLRAAEPAVVEAVQYPAWLERGGRAVPLTPGTALQSDDRIRTGDNARVQIKLSEGSTVKLGEKAKFEIVRVEDRGIFKATLSVLTGAFRFTTDALKKSRQRDVSIKAKNVTAGVRGTDLWGKSDDDKDLVCLLEGKITVGAEGHPTVTLDNPLDFYQKPRDGNPQVAKVDQRQIDAWAVETEIAKDGAAARSGGRWRVIAGIFKKREAGLPLSRQLRASGYPAEIVADKQEFWVQIPGLAGEVEARALMANLRQHEAIAMPLVREMPR